MKLKEKIYSRQEHEQYCQTILEKAKQIVRVFVMDQDGTVKGGNEQEYKKSNVSELLQKIVRKGKYPSIITASGVSALKSFSSLEKFYSQENIDIPIFIAIGNGAALYRFDKNGRTEIYNNELTLEEVTAIIRVWEQVCVSLNIKESNLKAKGLETFRGFIIADWGESIPKEYLEVSKQYNGRCFVEKIKATVVFPDWDDEKQRKLVKQLQESLNRSLGKNKYSAIRGDDTFLHITHAFDVDSKVFAFRTIMGQLKMSEENIAVFGDMPLDNDRGLLIDSGLFFSFTNSVLDKIDIKKPPFILPGSSISSVGSVHRAIDYLLM